MLIPTLIDTSSRTNPDAVYRKAVIKAKSAGFFVVCCRAICGIATNTPRRHVYAQAHTPCPKYLKAGRIEPARRNSTAMRRVIERSEISAAPHIKKLKSIMFSTPFTRKSLGSVFSHEFVQNRRFILGSTQNSA